MGNNLMAMRRRVMMAQPHEEKAEGAVASFVTNLIKPMQVTCTLSPVQSGSGDPYPPGGGKNLFDKDNANVVNGYIHTNGTFSTADNQRTIYIPIKPNTTYTVSKMLTTRFSVATAPDVPTNGQAYTGRKSDASKTNLTITSGANDAYIWVWLLATTETVTLEEVLATLQIEEGSTATAYSPYSNIRPITGWTGCDVTGAGVNLCNPSVGRNEGKLRGDDGTESSTSSSGYTAPMDGFLPNTNYTISGQIQTANGSGRIYFLDSDGNWISRTTGFGLSEMPYTFTTPANCRFIEIQYNNAYTALTGVQVEKGSSASSYTTYTCTTIPITWQTEAGTVYGCYFTLNRDGSVTLTANMAKQTVTGITSSNIAYSSSTKSFYINSVPIIPGASLDSSINEFKGTSSKFVTYPGNSIAPWSSAKKCYIGYVNENNDGIRFCIPSKSAVDQDVVDAINGTEICYELATPLTYTLSASVMNSLIGQNNVWADAGDVSVRFLEQ